MRQETLQAEEWQLRTKYENLMHEVLAVQQEHETVCERLTSERHAREEELGDTLHRLAQAQTQLQEIQAHLHILQTEIDLNMEGRISEKMERLRTLLLVVAERQQHIDHLQQTATTLQALIHEHETQLGDTDDHLAAKRSELETVPLFQRRGTPSILKWCSSLGQWTRFAQQNPTRQRKCKPTAKSSKRNHANRSV
jgi:chromosome segregation ATPase